MTLSALLTYILLINNLVPKAGVYSFVRNKNGRAKHAQRAQAMDALRPPARESIGSTLKGLLIS